VKILTLANKPEIRVTARNDAESARIRFVKAVLDYTWRYSKKAVKVRLPWVDIFITRRKDG
jgi:hypothetical protein